MTVVNFPVGQQVPLLAERSPGEVEKGGGPPHDGGMDVLIRRVESLEGDMKEVRKDLSSIKERLASIEGKLSNMPTTFQIMSWFIGVSFSLVGLTFAIAKLVK